MLRRFQRLAQRQQLWPVRTCWRLTRKKCAECWLKKLQSLFKTWRNGPSQSQFWMRKQGGLGTRRRMRSATTSPTPTRQPLRTWVSCSRASSPLSKSKSRLALTCFAEGFRLRICQTPMHVFWVSQAHLWSSEALRGSRRCSRMNTASSISPLLLPFLQGEDSSSTQGSMCRFGPRSSRRMKHVSNIFKCKRL